MKAEIRERGEARKSDPELQRGQERMRELRERNEQDRQERYQFHERLLASLERQNALLERIATLLGRQR